MATPTSPPSAHVVGNMFVEQYYPILHHKPEEVYKFYQDSSVLSRPDSNGDMISVTTMKAIDETVKDLDYKNYKVVIWTVDAQHSHKDGVVVLVTGCLTGKVNFLQKFTQTFFLAPQENGGFFVLNDVFRYISDNQPVEADVVATDDGKDTVPDAPVDSVPEPSVISGSSSPDPIPTQNEEITENKEVPESTPVEIPAPTDSGALPPEVEAIVPDVEVQEDAPKKSYASIVKVSKGGITSSSVVSAPMARTRTTRVNTQKPTASSTPPPVPETSQSVPENSNSHVEVEGHSIYVRNLPLNATASQLEAEFKKFGQIKPGGVQVRNHKHGYCFGFVEFEELSSMHAALKASSVSIAGRLATIEEKRTTTRVSSNGSNVGSGRGRFPSSRGGFRNESFRGRGGFGGGRGEFRSRGDFPNRWRGSSGRPGEGYQRAGRSNTNDAAPIPA